LANAVVGGIKNYNNNKINFINLSSFLKKNDKPLEFKVISQNSSRSEIRLDSEQENIKIKYNNPPKNKLDENNVLISRVNNKSANLNVNENSNKNLNKLKDKNKINMNVLSQKETEETLNDNLFTFHRNEFIETNNINLTLDDLIIFRKGLSNLTKNKIHENNNSKEILKELSDINSYLNKLLN